MNLHASLVADLLLYNFDWLYNVLSSGVFEERCMETKEVIRYTFSPEDIDKLYLWTTDTKSSIGKIRSIRKLGYDVEVINSMNLYDYIFEPEKDKEILVLRRFVSNAKSQSMCISYGPIFLNHYTDLSWHKAQFRFIWSRVQKVSMKKVYLDFNINNKYLNSSRLNGIELTPEEKEEFIDYVKDIVGDNVSILEKPNFFHLDSRKDFDFGEKNFCFGRSYLNIGIDDMHLQKAKEMLHYKNSKSLILNKRPDEEIYNRSIKQGKFQDEAFIKRKKEKEKLDIVNNAASLFDALSV